MVLNISAWSSYEIKLDRDLVINEITAECHYFSPLTLHRINAILVDKIVLRGYNILLIF